MKTLLFSLSLFLTAAASAQQVVTVNVSNPSKLDREDEPVVISLAPYGDVRSALVTLGGEEVACQLDDLDGDETFDELCFLSNIKGKQKLSYTVKLFSDGEPRQYPARVYAEMVMGNKSVKEKNRQNNYIEAITARGDCAYSYNLQHHHGVDFESELNGIRIYFDARQTLDLYGKFHKGLELQQTQFYTSDEQKAQGYGDDVLWVGQTFGLGAFRGWDGQKPTHVEPVASRTQRIVSYGPLRTIVEVIDRRWQASPQLPAVNMTLRYTQYAGHRDTDVDVTFNRNVDQYLFSTGIINVKGSTEFSDHRGLRACWGTDYPAADTVKWKRETVGLAVLVPRQYVTSEEPANKDNYAYVLKIDGRRMAYKVAYCSANEDFGPQSAEEWFAWLQGWRRLVDTPIVCEVKAHH